MLDQLGGAMQLGDQNSQRHEAGQNDLFGLSAERAPARPRSCASRAPLPEWSEAVRLTGERETLGLYLTGHPLGALRTGPARASSRIASAISSATGRSGAASRDASAAASP